MYGGTGCTDLVMIYHAVTGLETGEVAVVAKAKLASKTLAIIHPD